MNGLEIKVKNKQLVTKFISLKDRMRNFYACISMNDVL